MKLFTRYSLVTLLVNILIFIVASLAFFFSLRYVLVNVIDEDLQIEEQEITAFIRKHDRLPENSSVSDQVIRFSPTSQPLTRTFSTVQMQEENDPKPEAFRRLSFMLHAAGKTYRADVSKSLEGTNNLLRTILFISVCTILLILLASAVINRVLLKTLWKPFYQSLKAVQAYRISRSQSLALPVTTIEEFSLMNQTLEGIASRSRLEYLSLKTFSENASHEIQTPIAIIRSKLDLLIQDEQLTEKQGRLVQSAYAAAEKLSRLNQSLLLLAKIENNQYNEVALVDLERKVTEKLQDFQELWAAKAIAVDVSLQEARVKMNPELADILLNNLFSNATNHNEKHGHIWVELQADRLAVGNTSAGPELEPHKLFQRFYKPSTGSTRNGLGLSLIKQIADVSDFAIQYQHTGTEHVFMVLFRQEGG